MVPRYGRQVRGGAETGARQLASRLALLPDWSVEVLTTTAVDSGTWREELAAGSAEEDGVLVRRFACRSGRHPDFDAYSGPTLSGAADRTEAEARDWIERQGPVSPGLIEAVRTSDADAVAFYPYLYHPTAVGLPLAPTPTLLHAAAHDEPAIRLPIFQNVFGAADGLVFHSRSERDLVGSLFPVGGHRQIVLGLGVDDAPPGPIPPPEALGGRPFLLCLGRVDEQKGVGALWRFFLAYKRRRPGPLALVLAGPVVDAPPGHPDLVVTGPVSEALKWSLLRHCQTLVSPSPFESFSLVVAEAWAAGSPVLVNAVCAATMENVRRSGGGLHYRGYAEFEGTVDRLLGDPGLRAALAARGAAYVSAHFSWTVVIERYRSFVLKVVSRADPRYIGPAPGSATMGTPVTPVTRATPLP